MSKGGDRRPIHKSEGRELKYASLLMQAMTEETTEAGLAFNRERDQLFRRWERLVRVLMRHPPHGWGMLPSDLDRIGDYLEHAVIGWPVIYPKPRPLTPMEDAVLVCRQNAASEALDDLHQELLPYQPNRGEETQVWEQVNVFLNEWINEIFFIANPGRKRRTSIHPMVRKYPKEVESFCRKWHLDAWWAVPAIIQSHFLRIEIGLDTPLGLFLVGSAGPINTFTVVARLPGFSDAEFERDSAKFSKAMMEQTDTFSSGPITVRWRPNRDEMAKFESEYDSACVVVDWNGRNHYPSRYARQQLTISEYLIEECEFRLGRLLTKSERRGILRQITPQIEDGRKWFLEAGWYVQGKAALQTHAQWVATRLLDPSQSWSKITGADADLLPSAISSCHQFAERALLTLPTRQSTGANASS